LFCYSPPLRPSSSSPRTSPKKQPRRFTPAPPASRPRAQRSRPKTTNTAITANEQNNINEDFVLREIRREIIPIRREIIPMQNELIFLRSSLVQAHMTNMNMFNYIEQQVINFGQVTIQLNNNIEQIQQEMERMRISGITQNSDISIIDPHFCAEVFGDNGNDDLTPYLS
jgi:hypothetical protein